MVTETAFQSAFDDHQDAVYRFAWRMAGPDAAEDIAQDVFLTLLRHYVEHDFAGEAMLRLLRPVGDIEALMAALATAPSPTLPPRPERL